MPANPNAPQFILAAVQRIYDQLPDLIGKDWPTIQSQIEAHIATLQAHDFREKQAAPLFQDTREVTVNIV